jgi:adhesin transport system outer membrane protein
VKSSDARVVAARQNVESARNDLRRRVQALLTDLQSLQQVLQSNEMLVQSTELTLASFMRQFDAGRRSWVDVMNSQREMSDARLAREQTRSSLLETQLRLAVQLGQFDQQAGAQP